MAVVSAQPLHSIVSCFVFILRGTIFSAILSYTNAISCMQFVSFNEVSKPKKLSCAVLCCGHAQVKNVVLSIYVYLFSMSESVTTVGTNKFGQYV